MSEFSDLCSTDGDFDLDSEFRRIPGMSLKVALESIGVIHVSCFAMIEGEVHLSLLVDGIPMFHWAAEHSFSMPFEINVAGIAQLEAGAHEIALVAKSTGAAGPRDWSPRWEKEGKPFGKILRSPQRPLRLIVVKV